MIRFPVLFDGTQFQTIRVKTLRDTCQILGEKLSIYCTCFHRYVSNVCSSFAAFFAPRFPPDNVETCQGSMNGS